MTHICCVSDYSFLPRGLALYESLSKYNPDFYLHYLCIDKQTHERLQGENDRIVPYDLNDFLSRDEALLRLKESDYRYFCWTLASYFTDFLVGNLQEDVTYIDSDIYFYSSIHSVIAEIGQKDIGLFRHRQNPLEVPNGNGWFNVGVVHFKNTHISTEALAWWKDAVLHKKHPELATCGDQRYLDAFVQLDKKHLFIEGDIGHGSPWEWQLYNFDSYDIDGCITWGDKKEKLVFSHFSQFEYSIEEESYTPSTTHYCFTPLDMYSSIPQLKSIHDDYFGHIKKIHKEYNL